MRRWRRSLRAGLVLLVAFRVAACDEDGPGLIGVIGGEQSARTTVVIDTDMSFDDALAILFLLDNPDIDLVAITVTGTGFATLPAGVDNALRLVALAGDSAVIVAAGAKDSRSTGMLQDDIPPQARVDADLLFGLALPQPVSAVSADPVSVVLRDVLDAAEGDVVVVATGPLTNLANVIQVDPTIAERITRLVVFGGAFGVPGDVATDGTDGAALAEWNMYLDPVAAEEVFSAGIPTELIPLDAARRAPVTRAFVALLAGRADTPSSRFVAAGLAALVEAGAIEAGYAFRDLLAAVVGTDDAFVEFQAFPVRVVTVGDTIGRTLVDITGDSLRVATAVNPLALEQRILTVLTGN